MQVEGGISDEEMEREVKQMSGGGDISVEEEEREFKRRLAEDGEITDEEEEREVKIMLAEDGQITDEEEEREEKRMRLEEGDVSVKGKSIESMLFPSLSLDECKAALSALNNNKRVMGNNTDSRACKNYNVR